MLEMTFLSMFSDSITAVLNISLHTLSVSLLMMIFLTCSLSHHSYSSTHASNHYRDHFHSVSWSSLSSLKGELLILLSFLRIFFQDILLTRACHIYQTYYCDIRPSSSWLLILYSKSQLIFTCSFSNTAPYYPWLCIRSDLVPSAHSLCTMLPSGSSTGCYAVSCTL